jgi:hypothetical protein
MGKMSGLRLDTLELEELLMKETKRSHLLYRKEFSWKKRNYLKKN